MKKDEISYYLKKTNALLYIVLSLLIVNIFVTIIVNGNSNKEELYNTTFDTSSFTNIKLKDIEEYVDNDEYKLLVIGKPNCEYTAKMIPLLQQAQSEFSYETLYVDLREVTESDREVILQYDDETNFIEEYLGTTPFIIVFKENKMIDTWVGYQDYAKFREFLLSVGLEKQEN